MSKKIFPQNILRKTLLAIFFVIPFLFVGQVHAATPFNVWGDYTVPMTSCGEITAPGAYTLDPSFDNDSLDGNGNCFVISSDGVSIDGGGHTITGNVNGDSTGTNGYSFTILNATITGNLSSNGRDYSGPKAGAITVDSSTISGTINANVAFWGDTSYDSADTAVVTIANSITTDIYSRSGTVTVSNSTVGNINVNSDNSLYTGANPGGTVTLTNSTTSDITANGAVGIVGDPGTLTGSNGGTINIHTPSVYGSISINGGVGPNVGLNGASGQVYVDGVLSIVGCQTITTPGTYSIMEDIGTGGNCLTIVVDGVVINGNGHTINGDVIGNGINNNDPNSYIHQAFGFELDNVNVTGSVNSDGFGWNDNGGASDAGGNGGNITIATSTISGRIYSRGGSGNYGSDSGNGGVVTIYNSTTSDIYVVGGTSDNNGYKGGNGGTINIHTPSVYGTLSVDGGAGANNGTNGASGQVYVDGVLSIVGCQTITTPGTYSIMEDIGTGGSCVVISSGDVIIDGHGHTIDGNISGTNGVSFTVQNATVTGSITSDADPGFMSGPYHIGGAGGSITILNSTTTSITSGNGGDGYGAGSAGNISITNSVATVVTSGNGGNGFDAGSGGSISINNSIVTIVMSGNGGTASGGNNHNGGNIDLTNSYYLAAVLGVAGTGGNGGSDGILTINNSYIGTPVTSCQTFNTPGAYSIREDIGTGGDCLIINTEGVSINGNGHTITGNVNGDAAPGYNGNGYSFGLQNIIVTGSVRSDGADGCADGCFGASGTGGNITISSSTINEIDASAGSNYSSPAGNGGNIYATSSTITTINSLGTDYSGMSNDHAGGNGGNVNLTDSVLLGSINVAGGGGGISNDIAIGTKGTVHLYTTAGPISSCQTIYSSGTYDLTNNIGSGGDCISIQTGDVVINGHGHTVNGNVNGDSMTIGGGGFSFELNDTIVTGSTTANGKSSNNVGVTSKAETGLNINGLVYINDTYLGMPISSCQTLSSGDGTYTLTKDIGDGTECLRITANGVVVRGNGHVVTGNINGNGPSTFTASPGYNFSLNNIAVNGTVTSNGTDEQTSRCGSGGFGGTITITDSTLGSVSANGGSGLDYMNCRPPAGNGGTINITNPSNTGTLSFTGGTFGQVIGYNDHGNGSNDYGSNLLSGGNGGTITLTGTNLSLINNAISTIGGSGRDGSLAGLNGTVSVGKSGSAFDTINHTGAILSALAHLIVYGYSSAGDLGPFPGGPFPTLPGETVTTSSACNFYFAGTYYLGADIAGCTVNHDDVVINAQNHTISSSTISSIGSILTNNILLYHMEDSSGSIVDSSGNGNNGSVSGSINYLQSGVVGNSIRFNGSESVVSSGNSSISGSASRTTSLWFRNVGTVSSYEGLISYGNCSSSYKGWETLINDNGSVWLHVCGNQVMHSFSLSNHDWHMLTTTYDGSKAEFYVDGVSVGSINQAIDTVLSNIHIGNRFDGSGKFNGDIDEVGIWERALSSVEINSLYIKQRDNLPAIEGNGKNFSLLNATTTGGVYSAGATITISTSTVGVVNVDSTTGGAVTINNTHFNSISANGTTGSGGTVVINGSPTLNLASTTISVSGNTNGNVEFHYSTITSHINSILSGMNQFRIYGTGVPGQNLGNIGSFPGGPFPTLPGETVTTSSACNFYFAGTYYLGADIAGCTVNHDDVVINAQNHTISSSTQAVDFSSISGNKLLYHLDDISGSLQDSSGNSNTGTLHGNFSYNQAGITGNSIQQTGGYSTYISTQSNPLANLTSGTITMWVKPSGDMGATTQGLLDTYPCQFGAMRLYNNSDHKLHFDYGGGRGAGNVSIGNWTNQWHSVALTFDNTANITKLFIDGNVAASEAASGGTLNTLIIGSYNNCSPSVSNSFVGNIDEVGVWNRALSDSEISKVYTAAALHANAIIGNSNRFTVQNATTTSPIYSPGSTITISTSTIDTVNVDSTNGGTVTINNTLFNSISAKGTAGNGGTVTLNGIPNLNIASSTVNTDGTVNDGTLNVNYTNLTTNDSTFFYTVKNLYVNSILFGSWNGVFNPHNFYFNSERAGAGRPGDWNDPLNWWTDTNYTLHPGAVPNISNSVEIYSNLTTITGAHSVSAYSVVFHGTSTNSITINVTTGAVFNDSSGNTTNGMIIGQVVLNGGAFNSGIVKGITTVNGTSTNSGVIYNNATTTFNGDLASSTGDVSINTFNIAQGAGNRNWTSMVSASNGDIYAVVSGGDIYKQTGGTGSFVAQSAGNRNWTSITSTPNGDVYAAASGDDIYKQTSGTGSFVAQSAGNRNWTSITSTPNGDVYALVPGVGIFRKSGGGGFTNIYPNSSNWTSITSTPSGGVYMIVSGYIYKYALPIQLFSVSRNWNSITSTPNGDVYATVSGGDIYKLKGGVGSFVAQSAGNRNWTSITSTSNGDVYAAASGDDIYKQTSGTGSFVASKFGSLDWRSITSTPNGSLYAAAYNDDIYKNTFTKDYSGPITRVFTTAVTTTRNFLTEAGHNNWILVASGVAVDITNAVYNTATNIFKALFGGYFITGSNPSGAVTPQIVINSPTTETIYKWLPSINWDTSASCAYSYDNFTTTRVLDCSKNGSDIPKPAVGQNTLYVQGIDAKGNETQTSGVTFVYDNTVATYTICGNDLLDETSRPYYYLQGNVTGDCRATVNTELRGNIDGSAAGYTVSGNIIATTTGNAVSVILKNIKVLGDIHAEGVNDGTRGALTTISSSTVGNIIVSGASSVSGKGGYSGTLNISNSTTTAITAIAGASAVGNYATVGTITISRSNILGPIIASGNTDGGSAGLIVISTSTTRNIIANGGNGTTTGGTGGRISVTASLGVASSTITVNGGAATVCGYGGDSGTVTLRRSSYGTITAKAGADQTTNGPGLCVAPPSGHSGSGGSGFIDNDGQDYTPEGTTGGNNNDANNNDNNNNNAGWGSSNGGSQIYGITIPVNSLRPLDLRPLPLFGGNDRNSFNFLDPISRFVFEPLPNPITTALNTSAQLNYFMAGAGLSYAQSLVTLQKRPIVLGGSSLDTTGIWNPKIGTTTVPSTLALSGTSTINQNISVKAGQNVVISVKPIKTVSKVTAIFNGETVTLTLNKAKNLATYTLVAPSIGGKYTLTSKSAAFPLVIDVTGGIKATPKPLPNVSWWAKLGSWFGK